MSLLSRKPKSIVKNIEADEPDDQLKHEYFLADDARSSKKRHTKVKLAFCAIVLALAIAGVIRVYYVTTTDSKQIKLVERELRANAKLNKLEMSRIRVYHDSTGALVASWIEGSRRCSGVPIVEPKGSADLYGTESVSESSGHCISFVPSVGIN